MAGERGTGVVAQAAGAAAGGPAAGQAPWAALLMMVAAAFMDLLDGTIMQVALPSIERGMHVSDAGL